MKRNLTLLTLLAALAAIPSASAQERLTRPEALKYAFLVGADLKQLQNTPIATDPDLKHVVAMRDGEYGGMVLPETKLTVEALVKAEGRVVPIGQLWLLKLTPIRDGEPISGDKLRLATVQHEDGEVTVPLCALGVQRNSAGQLELLVYGKNQEPLLRTLLKKIDAPQQSPIEMTSERTADSAQVTLKILGSYEASLTVTELEL